MTRHWFKQLLSPNQNNTSIQDHIDQKFTALTQAISDNDKSVQKNLRRLSLAQKQQSDAIESLTQESITLSAAIADRHGVVLSYSQLITQLDHLYKIAHCANDNATLSVLVERAIKALAETGELTPLVCIHEPYPEHGCEVVGSIDSSQDAAGTVHEIVQQGYCTADGDIIRGAKVIVVRAQSTHHHSSQEESGYAQ